MRTDPRFYEVFTDDYDDYYDFQVRLKKAVKYGSSGQGLQDLCLNFSIFFFEIFLYNFLQFSRYYYDE